MDVCHAPLINSFNKSPIELWTAYFFGNLGILGWGLSFESLFRSKLKSSSLSHAFLEGTVLVSFILLALSLLGLVSVAWPVAIFGITLGLISKFFAIRSTDQAGSYSPDRSTWDCKLAFLLTLPAAFCLVVKPLAIGDTSAIWGYHAKVLSCFPLFKSNFVLENVWTGTHPEYPLFLSFMHSFFFRLSDSFRDDWMKLWQGISLLAAVNAAYFDIRKRLQLKLHAFTAVVLVLCVLTRDFLQGPVELHSAIFIWLALVALLSNDRWRMSIYLGGFLFCKNEGVVGSLLFIFLVLAFFLSQLKIKKPTFEALEPRNIFYLFPFFIMAGLWIAVAIFLPSLHEQYPKHLLSLVDWKTGMSHVHEIVVGCIRSIYLNRDYRFLLFTIPLLAIGTFLSRRLRKDDNFESIALPLIWGFGMSGLFLAIYIVSPWGPTLYTITLQRLITEVYPAFVMSLVVATAAVMQVDNQTLKRLAYFFQILTLAYFGITFKNNSLGLVNKLYAQYRGHELGLIGYQTRPEWSQALRWDRTLPAAARGALLNLKDFYFTPNYMLFPRVLYPTDPSVIAGTYRDWSAWTNREEVPAQILGLSFIIDARTDEISLLTRAKRD